MFDNSNTDWGCDVLISTTKISTQNSNTSIEFINGWILGGAFVDEFLREAINRRSVLKSVEHAKGQCRHSKRSPSRQSLHDGCSGIAPTAWLAQGSRAPCASNASQSSPRYRSRASLARHELHGLPTSGNRRDASEQPSLTAAEPVLASNPANSRRNATQNNLSANVNPACGCRLLSVASCCGRARFSKSRSRRERTDRTARTNSSLSSRSMERV